MRNKLMILALIAPIALFGCKNNPSGMMGSQMTTGTAVATTSKPSQTAGQPSTMAEQAAGQPAMMADNAVTQESMATDAGPKVAVAAPPAAQGVVQGEATPICESTSIKNLDDFRQIIGDRVFFEYDKSAINNDGRATLQCEAKWMSKNPNVNVVIEGHTDERGTREYNIALGERRANEVKNYLVSLGISADRINTISYGKERPEVNGSNEASWAQNRRGVTIPAGM